MFKINPAPTFRAKVPLTVPGAENPALVEFEFRHKGRAAFAAWWQTHQTATALDAIGEVVAAWSGVIDDAGAEVPFSVGALTQVLDNYPASGAEILLAYARELSESRRKN